MGWATGYIDKLGRGETVQFRPRGNSMAGKIDSGQLCTVVPAKIEDLKVGDIVLCKVNGFQYLHLIKAIQETLPDWQQPRPDKRVDRRKWDLREVRESGVSMNERRDQLFICGRDELQRRTRTEFTHLITIANPGAECPKPIGFTGPHLQLWFGDVVSEADARQCRTKAPTTRDVQEGLEFFRTACASPKSKVLFSCDYGASRSPALAFVCLADQLGGGRESEALELILNIRPNAVPNRLVVHLGDSFLGRKGALLGPLKQLYS